MSRDMKYAILAGIGAVTCIIAYGVFLIIILSPITQYSITNAGVFGDSFGVLTSLFSALAFAGVALTIAIQKDVFKQQGEEIKIQRKEAEDSRKEIIKQGFENSFFQMLKIHNQILNDIYQEHLISAGTTRTLRGRELMHVMIDKLEAIFMSRGVDEKSNAEKISDSYDRFYLNEGYKLAHYFRFLYNILRFLSEHEMDNKDLYAKLIRAQISNQELYLIYYNSFTERGKNFKKYMIEFQLMDNLPPSELATDEHAYLIPNVGFKFPKIK